jgi:hypothetical protein
MLVSRPEEHVSPDEATQGPLHAGYCHAGIMYVPEV